MAIIPLSNGGETLIDDADLPLIAGMRFYRSTMGYAQVIEPAPRLLHRLLLAPAPGLMVDHINHDKLDNRRANLRAVSNSINQHNRMQHGGINAIRTRKGAIRFRARIELGRSIHLGYFDTVELARAARRGAELALGLSEPTATKS